MKRIKHVSKVFFILSTIALVLLTSVKQIYAQTDNNDQKQYIKVEIADINLETKVPDDLVVFTRATSANNSKLALIGVENIEELKTLMIKNSIYLEVVPEDVNYEIVISGRNSKVNDFNSMSEEELNYTFQEYIKSINNEDKEIKEEITNSSIYKTGDEVYFVLDVTSVSESDVKVYVKKYFTVRKGKAVEFVIQTNSEQFSEAGLKNIKYMVDASEYKEIKKSIFSNQLVSDIGSMLFNVLVPIAFLVIVFLIVRFTTVKSKKNIEEETNRILSQRKKEQEEKQKQDSDK